MNRIFNVLAMALFAVATVGATDGDIKEVNTETSVIEWTGKKVLGMGAHNGTIKIKSGSLEFDGDALVGGSFVIDMTTITNVDMAGKNGAGRLEGHLKSDDFFGVQTYPEATLSITSAKAKHGSYEVTADLTIKGKTAPVTFMADVTTHTANAAFDVDRTLFDVKYGSGKFFDDLGDKAISDQFNIVVKLTY